MTSEATEPIHRQLGMTMTPEGGTTPLQPPAHPMTTEATEPIHRQLGMTMTPEGGRPPSNPPLTP